MKRACRIKLTVAVRRPSGRKRQAEGCLVTEAIINAMLHDLEWLQLCLVEVIKEKIRFVWRKLQIMITFAAVYETQVYHICFRVAVSHAFVLVCSSAFCRRQV